MRGLSVFSEEPRTTCRRESGWNKSVSLRARLTPKTSVKQVPKSTSGHQVSQVRISSVFREMTFKMSKGEWRGLRS